MSQIPGVGHVIKYAYLWWNEHRRGADEGRKERPACVLFNQTGKDNETTCYVLPITHTTPNDDTAIKIPLVTKQRLGLDNQPSWIITSEYNQFTWPGYDIRRCENGTFSYGVLPESIIKDCIAGFKKNNAQKQVKPVPRD